MSVNVDLFYFINHNLQNPICDAVMPYITHFGGFVWLLIILIVLIVYAKLRNKETLKKVAILALCALLFADLIAYAVKLIVQEPRPYLTMDNVRLLIHEDDVFAFPSGHATSTLAVVSIFFMKIKDFRKLGKLLSDLGFRELVTLRKHKEIRNFLLIHVFQHANIIRRRGVTDINKMKN